MQITIAVATYLRPSELGRLLQSIAETDEPACGWPAVRLVVVDNDPAGSARAVFEEVRGGLPMDTRYVVEERPGHAWARNRSLLEAIADGSEFVQFIDDDEVVSSSWLAHLTNSQAHFGSDFVCGAVRSVFDKEPPRWVRESGAFQRRSRPTGEVMSEFNDGNLLARVRILYSYSAEPFAKELSLRGGADTLLSRTLVGQGARATWCEEGYASEVVPVARLRRSYVAKRKIRTGSTDAYCQLRLNERRHSRLWRVGRAGRAFVALGYRFGSAPLLTLVQGRRAGYRSVLSGLFNVGRFLGYCGFMVEEYSRKGKLARSGR